MRNNLVTLKPSQLRTGNIVQCHGMRVLLDGPIQSRSYPEQYGCTATFWQDGVVLNREEVSADAVPFSFTSTASYPSQGKPASAEPHRWQVQGNDNARFAVEIDSLSTAQFHNLV